MSDLLFDHLHKHLSLVSVSESVSVLYLYQRQDLNLHFRLGLHVTLQDIQWSMRSAFSRLWTWACMIKWYRAIHLFGLTLAMSERGAD